MQLKLTNLEISGSDEKILLCLIVKALMFFLLHLNVWMGKYSYPWDTDAYSVGFGCICFCMKNMQKLKNLPQYWPKNNAGHARKYTFK